MHFEFQVVEFYYRLIRNADLSLSIFKTDGVELQNKMSSQELSIEDEDLILDTDDMSKQNNTLILDVE